MSQSPPILDWMQSLSDPIRARLLRLLDRSELTVAELCSTLQLPQSTVSRHLKVLGDEDWIASRRDGSSNLYSMQLQSMEPLKKKLWGVVKAHSVLDSTAEQDDARLEQVLDARRSKSQAFFSSAAEKWDRIRAELFGSRMDAFALGATLDAQCVFGDLGCGTGGMSQLVAPWVESVIAVDSSAAMLTTARRRLRELNNVEVRKGELTCLPIDEDQLSISLMALVLPYVSSPQDVIAEVYRVTKPGGKLVILDMIPHDRSEYREQLGHSWQGFSEDQVTEWLEACQWKEIRYQTIPPDPDAKGTGLFLATAKR